MQPPYHPLLVHFPIALYLLGVLMTLGYLRRKEADIERFAYWLFLFSLAAAILASLAGLVDRGQLPFDDPRQGAIDRHITPAIIFTVLNALVVYARFRWPDILDDSKRWLYVGLIFAGVLALFAAGYWGGELVFGLQVGPR